MRKEYQIKVYSKTNVYLETINPNSVISNIDFSNNMNSGQGNINIKINSEFGNTSYVQGNIIKITLFDENYPTGNQVYLGFINSINRIQSISSQHIELECIGIFGLLNNTIFDYLGSPTSTIVADPGDIIKYIIDSFNVKYPGGIISYSGGNIDLLGTQVSLAFSYDSCFESIQKAVGASTYRRYIDSEGQFWFKAKPSSTTHTLTNQLDVESIEINDDIQDVVNKLYLTGGGGTGTVIYQDAGSQTLYGIKESTLTKTELTDAPAMTVFGNNFIAQNKDSKKETKVVINSRYAFESIMPGHTIKIINFGYVIDGLQVLGVSYSPQKTTLTLEKKVSFGNEIVG